MPLGIANSLEHLKHSTELQCWIILDLLERVKYWVQNVYFYIFYTLTHTEI